jgi:hypothetical protein
MESKNVKEFKDEFSLLRRRLDDYRERINDLEKRINEDENGITSEHMRSRVAEFDSDPKWKAFVADKTRGWNGVVEDIMHLLDDCYSPFIEFIKEEHPDKVHLTQSILGKKTSKQWFEFQFCVIKELLNPKDNFDEYDYADTANGCDEVAWDGGISVILKKISLNSTNNS